MIIFVDTLRADHLGCYGYPGRTSPEIDALARRGTLWARAYSTAPWTYPSSASLVTGLYPAAHGGYLPGEVRNHNENPYPPTLSPDLETLPEILGREGWRSALFSANAYVGMGVEQGFERYSLKEVPADRQVNLMLEWVESLASDEKFLGMIHFMDVHEPNRPPRVFRKMFPGSADVLPSEVKRYETTSGWYAVEHPDEISGFARYRARRLGVYNASVRFTDQEIGRLVRRVEELRPDGDTMYIVLADHGEEFWDHGAMEAEYYEDPRGVHGVQHGHSFFNELVRIPLVVLGTGSPGGRVATSVASIVDVVPTVLDNLRMVADTPLQGMSLMPVLHGATIPRRTLLLDALAYGRDNHAAVQRQYKLVNAREESVLLFDLLDSPAERKIVTEDRPEVVQSIAAVAESLDAVSHELGRELRGDSLQAPARPDENQMELLKALGYVQ